MKICKIHIKGFQQFEDTVLDFTHPETGEPLEKICFIGRNGTGKSTLLRLIDALLRTSAALEGLNGYLVAEIKILDKRIYLISSSYGVFFTSEDRKKPFISLLDKANSVNHTGFVSELSTIAYESRIVFDGNSLLSDNASDLLIYSPTEVVSSQQVHQAPNKRIQRGLDITNVPNTNLSAALELLKRFPYRHEVSDEKVQEFWKILIYLIKKRENEREQFENKPDNLNKTKKQLIEEFEKTNPKIEEKLAELWNEILGKAGLELDLENLKKPVQLNDNLHAYIRLKSTKQRINYNQLSTGIRNFIFRIGHIYSLYFNREIKRGFLLVDEPENSLFPDFLFNLMELYQKIVIDKNGENNTQFFVATHSPIVAAQFQPYERIILEWDDNGHVTAHKGRAPVGDDPNDVLEQDFGLENLMGKEGQKMWQRYLDLRKKLRRTENPVEKEQLINEITKIGNDYNFEE